MPAQWNNTTETAQDIFDSVQREGSGQAIVALCVVCSTDERIGLLSIAPPRHYALPEVAVTDEEGIESGVAKGFVSKYMSIPSIPDCSFLGLTRRPPERSGKDRRVLLAFGLDFNLPFDRISPKAEYKQQNQKFKWRPWDGVLGELDADSRASGYVPATMSALRCVKRYLQLMTVRVGIED